MPVCWGRLCYSTTGTYVPKIVKGTATGTNQDISLHSSCLQMRVWISGYSVSYVVFPEIATDLNTLEVSFSLSSAVCDSSCLLSLGYLTNDTVFEEVNFVTLESFRNSYLLTDPSARYEVSLEGFVFPENARLAFRLKDQYSIFYNTRKGVFIDDILIRPIPTCRKPIDIETTAVSDTSVTLRWQPLVADVPFRIEYGLAGFLPGTGTSLVTSSSSITLHPLEESTEYEVYIQTLCGGTDSSEAACFRFQTDCSPIVMDEEHPYFEDFADSTFACWRQSDGFQNGWQADTGRLFSSFHGNGCTRRLQSPVFDLSHLYTTPDLYTARCIFSYQQSSLNPGTKLCLYYRTAATAPWMLLKTCMEGAATDTVFLPYASDNYQISFVANKHNNEVAVSSVLIEAVAGCMAPPCPHLLRTEDTAAQIAWGAYYQGAAVELEYGPAGFVIGTGTRISVTDDESSRWISGLLPNTAYEVYARQECAWDVWSDWSLPLVFTTRCGLLTLTDSMIFVEDFEGMEPGSFPECWMRFSEGSDESYFPHIYQGDYTPDNGGTALILTATHLSSDLWTVGPQSGVALPLFSNPLAELELSFTTSMSATRNVCLEVGYLDTDDLFMPLTEVPSNYYFSQDWSVTHVLKFRDFGISDTLRGNIAFRWSADSIVRSYVCLDDIRVRPMMPCDYPLDVRMKELPGQSYVVTWQSQDPTQNLWEVNLSGTVFTTTTDSCSLGVLPYNTDYFVIVRTLCGESHSYWSDTLFFHTACECFSVGVGKPYFEDFTDYESSFNVYEMADQPDCWSFFYNGYYEGFAPHVYNGSYALNNPSILLSVGVQGGAIGRELYAILPTFCNEFEELQVNFDLYNSRDTNSAVILFGYLTDRYDPTTFQLLDTVPPHFYTDASNAHRRYYLGDYAPFPDYAHLTFKLNSSDQGTHFYSIDNVLVSLVTDSVGIDERDDNNGTFSLYPNPTNDIVIVNMTPETLSLNPKIYVLDIYGRWLETIETFHKTSLQVDLSSYANGIYLLKMTDGTGRVLAVQKVVKE